MKNFMRIKQSTLPIEGSAKALIETEEFKGEASRFSTDGFSVYAQARQDIDSTHWRTLNCTFDVNITSGDEHEYVEGGKIMLFGYAEFEKIDGGTIITPYPAVSGSGTITLTFNRSEGMFAATFGLQLQNTGSILKCSGEFVNFSGLVTF